MTQPPVGLRTVPELSPRLLQVLKLAAEGRTNEEIAALLHLSVNSVKTHMARAFKTLRARNRCHAVALCLAYGLVEVGELRPFSLPPAPASAAAVRWASCAPSCTPLQGSAA
ncbi:helix-turn-helix transcriptional regulator [Streptomyces sp. NPDC002812]|uniref:response regulator transcription factor n=1 Tax=Streptomyces sp. NPDC002812 TaxID=3154434 RepID=UPI00332A1FF9